MLNPALQQLVIAGQGERVLWYRAHPCSCYDPATNYDEQEACELCDRGFIYRLEGTYRVGVQAVRREFAHPDFGLLQVGDLLLTSMPDDMEIANWDRVVLLDREFRAWDRCIRGTRDTLTNAGQHVTQVVAVSDSENVYTEATEWVFTPPSTIGWVAGGPSVGAVYAVLYARAPQFWYVGGEHSGARPTQLSDTRLAARGRLVLNREEGP